MVLYDRSYWRPRPVERDFSIDVISRHPEFDNKALRKFPVDGIDSVGVWGDEPFEIHFKNNSFETVQVRVSLDGTDVMTGKPADLEINTLMWVVRAGRTLHLKAWHESQDGGSRFVFTGMDKSVALHAHGDVSHKGIISVAVFTDSDRPVMHRTYDSWYSRHERTLGGPPGGARRAMGTMESKSASFNSMSLDRGREVSDDIAGAVPAAAPAGVDMSKGVLETFGLREKSMKKEAAVGAGEFTSQKSRTVKGFDKPVLNSIIRVRYMWWDDLQAKLKDIRYEDPHPTGFPAEKIKTFADLSGVPKIDSAAATRIVANLPITESKKVIDINPQLRIESESTTRTL